VAAQRLRQRDGRSRDRDRRPDQAGRLTADGPGRLALFDLDNTLIESAPAFRAWAEEFVAEHGLPAEVVRWFVEHDVAARPDRRPLLVEAIARYRLAADLDTLWERYLLRIPVFARCFPDVPDALRRLRAAGWRVGIITNGPTEPQLAKIRHAGLVDQVDSWTISGAEGMRKPDPRLFEIAARRCGAVLSAGGWIVGDNPEADVAGGHAAGLRTVWIPRGDDPWPPGIPPAHHVVTSVAEAVALLAG
jgi:HAD superfamily hydrolase (TIGR01549 family)